MRGGDEDARTRRPAAQVLDVFRMGSDGRYVVITDQALVMGARYVDAAGGVWRVVGHQMFGPPHAAPGKYASVLRGEGGAPCVGPLFEAAG